MIGNLTFDDPSEANDLFDNVVTGDGQISNLAEATKGRFLLNNALVGTLAKYTGFKELRIRCFKPWHGRTVSVILKAEYLIKMLPKHGLCGDNEIRFLLDDTSYLSSVNCAQMKTGYNVNSFGLYNHILYMYHAHVNLHVKSRFECDDYIQQSGFTLNGSWIYFVR